MDRNEYLEVRKEYNNQESQQTNNLDKYLLTISTGSFGLSFLFVWEILKGGGGVGGVIETSVFYPAFFIVKKIV